MLAETNLHYLLVEVLSRLPSDIREKMLDDENGLFFYVTDSEEGGGELVNCSHPVKTIIWFDEHHLLQDEQKAKHTIAHEIAHYVLEHEIPTEKPIEREAEDLARKWGFE